jgi:inosine-uridine nucleoside N-ribohydrolase
MFYSKASKLVWASVTSVALLSGCGSDDDTEKVFTASKLANAQPVIWIGDFNNFDDAVALMLVAKDPRYTIELVVVEDSFNTVAHGANTVYNILEWLGNRDTHVIRGAYFSPEEIHFSANGVKADGTAVTDENEVVEGVVDYRLPGSGDNLERRNVMGINLYGQYVPGPWRDNGSTLYSTDHLIPRASQSSYHYTGNKGVSFEFEMAEDIILEKLEELDNVVILNTGKLTTFARVLSKGTSAQLAKIDKVVMMGGGFEGEQPFTAENNRDHNKGGNIFSHPSFGFASDFSTDQEFNILLDPLSAKVSFDLLAENNIESYLVPTNSTDLAKLETASIAELEIQSSTPEACYTSKLFTSIREFEGGDHPGFDGSPSGDFALDAVIRLWDIVAALVLLEPDALEMDIRPSYVAVDQLDAGLELSEYRYDPITFDPTVGKTTLIPTGTGEKLNVILGINTVAAHKAMIQRLLDTNNAAVSGPSCRE